MGRIVATPGSGDWFVGGVVAYWPEVKYGLLDVPEGPVITAEAACAMARGVRELFGADLGIATTGVAGPDSEEGVRVGSVFIGIVSDNDEHSLSLRFDGDPDRVRSQAVEHAFRQILHARTRRDGPDYDFWGGFLEDESA